MLQKAYAQHDEKNTMTPPANKSPKKTSENSITDALKALKKQLSKLIPKNDSTDPKFRPKCTTQYY